MEEVISYVLIISFVILIVVSTLFLINEGINSTFKKECESSGGIYFEAQNVTCEAMYPQCYKKCIIFGNYYDFYDKNWRNK